MIFERFKEEIIGNNKVISTSKIKKITAIKKNCIEKGIRAEFLGSNPHSKGLDFSRSLNLFLDKIFAIIIIIFLIKKIIKEIINKLNIIRTKNI